MPALSCARALFGGFAAPSVSRIPVSSYHLPEHCLIPKDRLSPIFRFRKDRLSRPEKFDFAALEQAVEYCSRGNSCSPSPVNKALVLMQDLNHDVFPSHAN